LNESDFSHLCGNSNLKKFPAKTNYLTQFYKRIKNMGRINRVSITNRFRLDSDNILKVVSHIEE
jgi:hypothetical protein